MATLLPDRSLASPPEPASGELDRPHEGFVPGREGGPFWTRVFDATSGRPIEGATFVRHAESAGEGELVRAAPLGIGRSDATGLAWIERLEVGDEKPPDAHWVVRVPGYATACEYGAFPPREVVLRRGASFALTVRDPVGCPTPGARVEWFDGCSHAPSLAQGTTDDDGHVVLADVDPSRGRLWVESGAGCLADGPLDLERVTGLGDRPATIVLHAGHVPHGICVDLVGHPVPGVLLRSQACGRGPATSTDGKGRFRLPVVADRGDLWVAPPTFWREHLPTLDDVDFDVPLRVVITPEGVVRRTWAGARARIVVTFPADPPTEAFYASIRADDGAVESVELAPVEGRPGVFEGLRDVAPDVEHVLQPVAGSAGESRHALLAPPFRAAVGAEVRVEARATPRARLRITGTLPKDARAVLVPGAPGRDLAERDEPTWLRRDAPALLRVDQGGLVRFFEVGPVDEEGVRSVDVAFPRPHVVRWPAGVRVSSVELRREGRRLSFVEEDDELRTYATGACEVVVSLRGDPDGVERVGALRLPEDRPTTWEFDPRRLPTRPVGDAAAYRVRWPDGAKGGGVRVTVSGGGFSMTGGGEVSASLGGRVTLTLPGHVTRRWIVTRAESRDVGWGTASIDVGVFDADGAITAGRVVVDGEPYDAPDGRLTLLGLEPGPHRLLVIAADEDDGGRELRIELTEGERRPLRVVLGE